MFTKDHHITALIVENKQLTDHIRKINRIAAIGILTFTIGILVCLAYHL